MKKALTVARQQQVKFTVKSIAIIPIKTPEVPFVSPRPLLCWLQFEIFFPLMLYAFFAFDRLMLLSGVYPIGINDRWSCNP
jgi:hypothetical protein